MKINEFDYNKMALTAQVLKDACERIAAIIGKEPCLRLHEQPPTIPIISNDFLVAQIMQMAARLFDVTIDDLKSPSRKRPLPDARGAAMISIKQHTKLAYGTIGLHFGGRDHSTVMTRIADTLILAKTEPELDQKIKTILKQVELLKNYDEPTANT